MKRALFILILLGFPVLSKAEIKPKARTVPTPATLTFQATMVPYEGGRMPFSNEEAKFYNKAWPIRQSHSLYALVLYGGMLLFLLTLLIRKMAQSGPRKPPAE